MAEKFSDRLSHAWNAFLGRDPTPPYNPWRMDGGTYTRPDRPRLSFSGNDKSIVNAIYTRIAMDCSEIKIEHCKVDENGNFVEEIHSGLNYCLNTEANLDQTSNAFIQDIVLSLCDEGVVAVVPVDTTLNPRLTGSFDIKTMRVGRIKQWFPDRVRINLYDEQTGKKRDIILPKSFVAIIENPLYSVMNEPNSVLKRLIRVLNNIDRTNEQNASGKLDLIIQLPYTIKSEDRKKQAEARRKTIEAQLATTKYGIAYTDATEKITQLNRSVENQLWEQATDLTSMLYNQLGLSAAVFDGTANEEQMLNYYSRTINPILTAISKEMARKFLTKTARTQNQTIWFYRDPFKLVPVEKLAQIADVFTRNEILSSNEVRALLGYKPSDDPRADELINSNINTAGEEEQYGQGGAEEQMEDTGAARAGEQPM